MNINLFAHSVQYQQMKNEIQALREEIERLRNALELITEKAKSAEVKTYSFFEPLPDKNIEFVRRKLMQFQTIAKAALQSV